MSRLDVTYLVVAVCAVSALAAFVALILVPAWSAYERGWQRLAATVLSLYVLAAMMGVGLAGAAGVVWIWDRLKQ